MDRTRRYMCQKCKAVMTIGRNTKIEKTVSMFCVWCNCKRVFIKLYPDKK